MPLRWARLDGEIWAQEWPFGWYYRTLKCEMLETSQNLGKTSPGSLRGKRSQRGVVRVSGVVGEIFWRM